MNYDTLIEATAVVHGATKNAVRNASLYPIPMPSTKHFQGAAILSSSPVPTMRLFKLHGSLNWHYSGEHGAAERVYDDANVGEWQQREQESWQSVRDAAAGLDPFIVPPTQSKSEYFDNGFVRGLWQGAKKQLEHADRLVIIGYSLPQHDLQIRSLLATSFRGSQVVVVNPEPSVEASAQEILSASTVKGIAGDDCVCSFVKEYAGNLAQC